MFSDLLALKEWKTENIANFYNRLSIFSNEIKCDYTVSVANELIRKNSIHHYKVAEEILINAIRNYFEVEDLNYKAKIYFSLGYLYEIQKKYINSFTYYEKYKINNNIYEGANSILLKIIILVFAMVAISILCTVAIIGAEENKNYTRSAMVSKAFDRILNQGWLHFKNIQRGLNNEN